MASLYHQATNTTSQLLSLPPKWLNGYGDFITKNASAVSQIESALRSLTYIIPGRFRDAEIASETVHSSVQLLSLYHDILLSRALAKHPNPQNHPSPHTRYTRFWSTKSPTYARLAVILQMLQHTQLLWEMVAKRRGEKVRWRVVVILEAVKALCRLILLRITNSRPLVSPPLPEREIDPGMTEESRSEEDELLGAESDDSSSSWTMPRTGLAMPTLPSSTDISSYLLSKVLTADDIKPPKALLHRVSGKGSFAEYLYILRPVVYAAALAHWSQRSPQGRKDWRPWLLGVSLEYGARQLAKRDFGERVAGGLRGLTGLEKEELRKRRWQLGWWAFRGAFWENMTKSWVNRFTAKLKDKPLLDIVGGVIEDYEFLFEEYYFSSATL
ncbi:peroxisomal membrane protein pex16 [Trichodelitschia bisporula]|uniref:Peroxisomal membrane protein PEX16 n=1 Tax=Trichodelitschia bisporula TaxID=703511 RepID=A0A6G1HQ78_9PEZI|nr:peroxisomal membrane protein pex16 [Trichodelitschia bisporula]